MATTRIAVLHQQRLVAEVLADQISREPRALIVGSASDAEGALELIDRGRPDVVIVGGGLVGDEKETAQWLQRIDAPCRVLLLGPDDSSLQLFETPRAGPRVLTAGPVGIDDLVAAAVRRRRPRSVEEARPHPPGG